MLYFRGVLALLDHTIRTMFGVPIFAVLLGGFVMAAILGLVLMMKEAAGGRRGRFR